ncbi:hypothetical protein ABPG72_003822 [Tetrahymena utriculariae]
MQTNSQSYNSTFFQQDKQYIQYAQTEPSTIQSTRDSVQRSIQQAYFEQIDINKPNRQLQNYYFLDNKNLRCFNNQRIYDHHKIQEPEALSTSHEQVQVNKYDKVILKHNKMQNKQNLNFYQSEDFKMQSQSHMQTLNSENSKIKLQQTNCQTNKPEKISKQLYYVTYSNSFQKQRSMYLSESQMHTSRTKKNLQQSQFFNKNKTKNQEFYNYAKSSDRKHIIEGNNQRSLTKILKMFGSQKGQQNSPKSDEYNLFLINSNMKKTLEFEKIDYDNSNKFKFKETLSKPLSVTNKNITTSSSHRSFSQSATQINFNGTNYGKGTQLISKYKNNRIIQFPVQTLKQLVSHRKYEESLNSYLQCNQNQSDQQEVTKIKFSIPFKAEFDRNEKKFTLKESTDLSNCPSHIPSSNNKFLKLDGVGQKYKKQSSLCFLVNQQNSNKQQNVISNITIPNCKQSLETSFANTAYQIQKPTSLVNSLFNAKSKKLIEEEFTQILDHTKIEDQKQELILNTIKNREKISNIIRLIEESPLDCIQGDNILFLNQIYEQIHGNQNNESAEKSITYNNEQSPTSKSTNRNEQKQFMLNILDDSYMKFTQQVQKEKTQYIISKEKLLHFQLFRSQKERKNLTKKQHRANLIKILNHIKNLNLTPKEIFLNNVFSTKPFEKQYSYEFITAAKHNNLLLCDFYITKNKYLVYDFDYFYLTALHWASKRGNLKLAQFLIQKGADVNATDIVNFKYVILRSMQFLNLQLGKTPLYYACQANHIETVKILLYSKAYPWSNKYISYDQFVKQNPQISNALFKARKIYSLMKMTPFKQRNLVWQQELVAFSQILV